MSTSRPEDLVPVPEFQGGDPGARQHVDELSVEEDLEGSTGRSYSQGQLVLRRFVRHKAAMTSAVVLVLSALLAFTSVGFGPVPGWWKYDWVLAGTVADGGRPTLSLWPLRIGEHPFGQDDIGKDYFALVMRGTQRSLIIAFVVGIVSTIIGTVVGAIAGYARGIAEAFLMRMTDLFIIIPLLVIAAVLGRMTANQGILVLALVLGAISWTSLARLVRGEVLSLREREFVAAARAVGTSPARIIVKHILPNTLGTIIVSATLAVASAILLETSLSYLGFGVRAPDTSLGLLISTYENSFTSRPWLFWWPGVFILVIALCVNFIGDGLRDAFDPRQSRKED